MPCLSGCPERMKGLLRHWGWRARGGDCGEAYHFAKNSVQLHERVIENDPTNALKIAVREELKNGRSKMQITKDVVPALLEGLDETLKNQGVFKTMRAVAETMEKLIDGAFKVSMDDLVNETLSAGEEEGLWIEEEARSQKEEWR